MLDANKSIISSVTLTQQRKAKGKPEELQGEARGKMKAGRKERQGNVRGMPKEGYRKAREKLKKSQRKAEGNLKDT